MNEKELNRSVNNLTPKLAQIIRGADAMTALVSMSTILGQIGIIMSKHDVTREQFLATLMEAVTQAYDEIKREGKLNG